MKRVVSAVVTTLVLVVAGPAQAEFSAEEKASAIRYQNAVNQISTAVWTYLAYSLNSYVTPATRPALTQAGLVTLQALAEANDGFSALVGDVTITQEGTPEFFRVEAGGRAHRIYAGLYYADRLTWLLPWARWLYTSAIPLSTDPTYQDYLRRAAETIQLAEKEIAGFNRNLPYLNPAPPTDPRFAPGTVVGPHGNFRQSHWHRWRGRHYVIRAMTSTVEALKAGTDGMSYAQAGRVLTDLGLIVQKATNETAATSGLNGSSLVVDADGRVISGNATEVFGRTLESLNQLTSNRVGIPSLFRLWSFDFRDVYLSQLKRSPGFDSYVIDAFMVAVDGWSHFDESAWQLNVFPGCPPTCVGGR